MTIGELIERLEQYPNHYVCLVNALEYDLDELKIDDIRMTDHEEVTIEVTE